MATFYKDEPDSNNSTWLNEIFPYPIRKTGTTITSHGKTSCSQYTSKLLRATTNKLNAYNSYNDHDNDNVTPYLPEGIMITASLIGILHNRI